MGYTHWNDSAFDARQNQRRATGTSAFTWHDHLRESGAARVHPNMDPYRAMRESRDSAAHPDSVAVGVIFDVTGSMGSVPRILQTRLGALMHTLISKGYLAHPQILFGGVGDAWTDAVPLQIGQFESGLEMDDDLGRIFLEGGGGGQIHESYELALYFFAHHTAIDCYEKRGHKGYLFTIGDEKPYPFVNRDQVQQLLGMSLEADLPVEQVIAHLHRRYEHFHIIPTNTYHGRDPQVQRRWQELLGERVLLLADEAAVCETIALAIGLCEGTLTDLHAGTADLRAAGSDAAATRNAANALNRWAARRS
jgi:hypothetical protein